MRAIICEIISEFRSAVVRLQSERGQVVVDHGPYAFVRHPGYADGILAYIAWPLTLGSVFAIIPTLIIIVLVVIRTGREDQFLDEKLDGYKMYAKKVRYRLLPWVW